MYNDEILIQGLEELGLAPDEEKLTLLHRYYERMIATNEVMNLTAITEYEDVCVKHFLESKDNTYGRTCEESPFPHGGYRRARSCKCGLCSRTRGRAKPDGRLSRKI